MFFWGKIRVLFGPYYKIIIIKNKSDLSLIEFNFKLLILYKTEKMIQFKCIQYTQHEMVFNNPKYLGWGYIYLI